MRTLPTLAVSLVPVTMAGFLVLGHAQAAPPTATWTVDGVDYPQCVMEDCSDVAGQVGVWIDPDTGDHWLSLGTERSVRVDQAHGVAAADGAVPGPQAGEYIAGTNPLDVFTGRRCTDTDAYAREVGDDDCDGTIAEGESGFAHWRANVHGEWIEGCGIDSRPDDNAGCAD
jgi:hypothetical protein